MPDGSHDIEIIFQDDRWRKISGVRQLACNMVNAAIEYTGYGASKGYSFSGSVLLTNDKAICALNHDFRGKNKPTNILSFPAYNGKIEENLYLAKQPGGLALGDMALAYETIEKEAKDQGKTMLKHTAHLCLHGVLHLLGFDHENEGEASMMEDVEIRILSAYRIANPYMI
jgi:probable rRNA maturation factor